MSIEFSQALTANTVVGTEALLNTCLLNEKTKKRKFKYLKNSPSHRKFCLLC